MNEIEKKVKELKDMLEDWKETCSESTDELSQMDGIVTATTLGTIEYTLRFMKTIGLIDDNEK